MKSFIDEIRGKGVTLEVVNNKLRYSGPKGAVNAEILSVLKQRKAEIVNLLTEAESATDPITKTCQNCRACALWRGVDRCFALALFDGKPGSPAPVLPKACERWQARD
jgi:hypothetical protein